MSAAPSSSVPTGRGLLQILKEIYSPPWWLWPGESVEISVGTLLLASDGAVVHIDLVSPTNDGARIHFLISGKEMRRVTTTRNKSWFVGMLSAHLKEALFRLQPIRDMCPTHVLILKLALQSMTDESAIDVLGDLIMESRWYDSRVITWLWDSDRSTSPETVHFCLAANEPEKKEARGVTDRLISDRWAAMRREWAKSIACHLLFGDWTTAPWFKLVCDRCGGAGRDPEFDGPCGECSDGDDEY